MEIGRWNPFRELANLREEINRFNERYVMKGTGPRLDIYETDGEVTATAELPGLESKDDVDIDVTEDSLSVRGEIKREKELEGNNYFHSERFYGSFSRTMALPTRVRPEKTTATYSKGILQIRMPKASVIRQRTIKPEIH